MHASLTVGVVLGLACAGTTQAVLINSTYVGPAAGPWATAANWAPAAVPGNGADTFNVRINNGGPNVTVTLASADVVCNGTVNIDDLLAVITGWGACPNVCPPRCLADINNSCSVNVDDLLAIITGWGACPP